MKYSAIKIFSIIAGILLIISGIAFYMWLPAGINTQEQADYIVGHKPANIVFVFSVLLSNVFITPVLLYLMILLYKKNISTTLITGSFFGFAIILETIATLVSLSQWAHAISDAAFGDVYGIKLFETLQTIYFAIDFPGVAMFYIAAIILGLFIRKIYPITFLILFISVLFFLIGGITAAFPSPVSNILTSLSICIYGAAYISFYPLINVLEKNYKAGE